MSCCGQKRAQLNVRPVVNTVSAPVSAGAGRRVPRASRKTAGVLLKYVGHGALVLRGPRSGRTYQMFETGDLAFVHPDDVEAMIRTRAFARER